MTTGDVLDFITVQRGDCRVVRLSDGESDGLSARTIQRRLSMVSGLFSFLVARGDVAANPVLESWPPGNCVGLAVELLW